MIIIVVIPFFSV